MISIIAGENAAGKTRVLLGMMEDGLYSKKYVTNIRWDSNPFRDSIPYDSRKCRYLAAILGDEQEEVLNNDGLNLRGKGLSAVAQDLIDLLSRKVDSIYLDEPEFNLTNYDLEVVIEYVIQIDRFHSSIFVVTHECGFTAVLDNEGSNVCTVDKEGRLVLVKQEDIYDAID